MDAGNRGGGQKTRNTPSRNKRWTRNGDAGGSEDQGELEIDLGHSSVDEEPELDAESREKFYRELIKAREAERARAIAEGKLDDPSKSKRLADAITIVGTCMDMCPRVERYRREVENILDRLEMIPGTKRVDHRRAVKRYERATGDKIVPSDLRPPDVLKRTLDYLFGTLIEEVGFRTAHAFVRDRSRACRTDFTIQRQTGKIAMECHERCARFHIMSLHMERDNPVFSLDMEEQQMMNTLQSLKEFYVDQRGIYESPTELEMRVYHRLVHLRDQVERHDGVPMHIQNHPVFKLVTAFRLHVQKRSAPLTKTSKLIVDEDAMVIFGELAGALKGVGGPGMVYLMACILEYLFGKDTIEDMESLRGDLSIPDLINGGSKSPVIEEISSQEAAAIRAQQDAPPVFSAQPSSSTPTPTPPASSPGAFSNFVPSGTSAFSNLGSGKNVFAGRPAFGAPTNKASVPTSAFGTQTSLPQTSASTSSPFQPASQPQPSIFGASSPFSTQPQPALAPSVFGATTTQPAPASQRSPFSFSPSTTPQPAPLFSATSQSPFTTETSQPPATNSLFAPFVSTTPMPFGSSNQAPKPQASLLTPSPSITPQPSPLFPAASGPPSTIATPQPPATNGLFAPVPAASASASTVTSIFGEKDSSSAPPSTNGYSAPVPSTSAVPDFFKTIGKNPAPPVAPAADFFAPPPRPAAPSPILDPRASPFTPTSSSATSPSTHSELPKIITSTPPAKEDPPPLPRKQPISLPPSTPVKTTSSFSSSSPGASTSKKKNEIFKNSLITSFPPTEGGSEMLSPLVLSSPTVSGGVRGFPSPSKGVSKQGSLGSVVASPMVSRESSLVIPQSSVVDSPPVKDKKGKGKEREKEKAREEDMEESAPEASASSKSKEERDEWEEACRRSELYHSSISHSPSPMKKRQREVSTAAAMKRRKPERKKRESWRPVKNDEELAERFRTNQEQHKARWAPGTFLSALPTHRSKHWSLWVSTNPENEPTAIWVERKFNIGVEGVEGGQWLDRFGVVEVGGEEEERYPGLIVFEMTPPPEGEGDELERKYRILDDCARLRDLVKSLPEKRYFVPSVVVFQWGDQIGLPPDVAEMVEKFVQDDVLSSYAAFSIPSRPSVDLDAKFSDTIKTLDIDIEGRLVKDLSLRNVFNLFANPLQRFLSEWMENCSSRPGGEFNYTLYSSLLSSYTRLLNHVVSSVRALVPAELPSTLKLDEFPLKNSSEEVYEAAIEWLDSTDETANSVIVDLEGHRNLGWDFPARSFLDQLQEVVFVELSPRDDSNDKRYKIPTSEVTAHVQKFQDSDQGLMGEERKKLVKAMSFSMRRSPSKRRSLESEVDESPSAGKRRRIVRSPPSPSPAPQALPNGTMSLSPDTSASPPPPSQDGVVTVAMLRALTRDLKAKYAS